MSFQMLVLLVYFSFSEVQFWLFFKLSDLFLIIYFSYIILFLRMFTFAPALASARYPETLGHSENCLYRPEYVGKTLREDIGWVVWLDKPDLKWLWRADRKETKTWGWKFNVRSWDRDSGFYPSVPIGNIGRALKNTQKWEPCIAVPEMLPRQFYCAAGMKPPTRDSWKNPATTPRVPKREGFHAGDQRLQQRWKGPGSKH